MSTDKGYIPKTEQQLQRHEHKTSVGKTYLEYWASGQEADENYRVHKHRAKASICLVRHLCAIDLWLTCSDRRKMHIKKSCYSVSVSLIQTSHNLHTETAVSVIYEVNLSKIAKCVMEFKEEFHLKVNEKHDILIIAKSATENKWKTCL